MSVKVSLRKCVDYDLQNVKKEVKAAVDDLGGMSAFVSPGETVLLKPNLLAPAKPEQAVTTHPAVVRAVAELVMEAGGKPFIADSSAIGAFKKVARDSGLQAVADELGIPISELKDSAEYRQKDRLFRILEISSQVMEADKVINLAKLKTHQQMYLTMGVKNMFGCIVGPRKAQWHFKAGLDRMFFARMIAEVCHAVSPDLTILDAVTGMEGDGPGTSGSPKQIGMLAVSADPVALDRVMADIIGADMTKFFVMEAAKELKTGETDLKNIEILRGPAVPLKVDNFIFPNVGKVPFGPPVVRKFILNNLTPKPVEARDKCTLCNKCIEICPTNVISSDKKRLKFDYDACIRCFCCVEVCPEGAMKPEAPLLLKIVS